MKILWLSRHSPLPAQIKELKKKFGDVQIIQYNKKVRDSQHVLELMRKYEADEIVAVLPLSIIARLCELGIKPLYMEMELLHECKEVPCIDFDIERDWIDSSSKRHYRFKSIKRIERIELVMSQL